MLWGYPPSISRSLLAAVLFMATPVTNVDPDPPLPITDEVTLLFTGDILVHTPVTASAARYGQVLDRPYDFAPMFVEVAPVISAADLAVCHLEVPIGVPGIVSSPFPRLAAPAAVADALAAAGFDGCSTASNHSLDFGEPGVLSTIAALDDAGVSHTGTAGDPGDANGILYEVDGLLIGHVSYSYGFNGFSVPVDQPWLANQIDAERILTDTARLKRVGADFVVVSLHWGAEYLIEPIGYQTDLAELLVASDGIDLIIGHHAHVVQPMAWVGGKPVAYGLGNFLSNQTNQRSEDGVILIVRLGRDASRWGVADVIAVPTWVDRHNGHVIRSALGATINGGLPAASAGRTEGALSMMGEAVVVNSVADARRWVLAADIAARVNSLCERGAC
ncbi:MAG: CapA family protein [Acidimicrobiia bacterium]|nr:CapA family protein [Acidimicrobiia bacterium]